MHAGNCKICSHCFIWHPVEWTSVMQLFLISRNKLHVPTGTLTMNFYEVCNVCVYRTSVFTTATPFYISFQNEKYYVSFIFVCSFAFYCGHKLGSCRKVLKPTSFECDYKEYANVLYHLKVNRCLLSWKQKLFVSLQRALQEVWSVLEHSC